MSPHDHKELLDADAWQWVSFLLKTGKMTIAEVAELAREQKALA